MFALVELVSNEQQTDTRNALRIVDIAALIAFCENAIKPYIPRIWANFLDFLAFERESDELWSKPLSIAFQKGKTTVEIAATHSNSIPLLVENDERRNDDIKFSRGYFGTGNWLPNTKLISFEPRIARNLHETHFALIFDNGNENMLFRLPRSFENQTCVDFAAGRKVTRDIFGAKKKSGVKKAMTNAQ